MGTFAFVRRFDLSFLILLQEHRHRFMLRRNAPARIDRPMHRLCVTATGSSPADFPLGSTQSRVAARALLSRRNTLSQYGEDALTLYRGAVYLNAGMNPNCMHLEATAAYRRGKEDGLYGNDNGHGQDTSKSNGNNGKAHP